MKSENLEPFDIFLQSLVTILKKKYATYAIAVSTLAVKF